MSRFTAIEAAQAMVGLVHGTRYTRPVQQQVAQYWVAAVEGLPGPKKGQEYINMTYGTPRAKMLVASPKHVQVIAVGLGTIRNVIKPMPCDGIADMLGALNAAMLMDEELMDECIKAKCYPLRDMAKPWNMPVAST